MNDTNAIRAKLAALAAAEEADPSPVWDPARPSGIAAAGLDGEEQTLTLAVDGPLYEALVYLARGTDGTLEETARKAILDAALNTRADDIAFAHTIAAHTA